MSRAKSERLYVVSYKEIFLIFLTFSLILVFLFPKDLLKEKLLEEENNYDLSVLYLQNMMRHDKLDEKLVMLLATRSSQIGKNALSLKLTKLLIHSKNPLIKREAILLRYRLLKEDYFYLQAKDNIEELEKIKKELLELFHIIIQQKYYTQEEVHQWYAESIFLRDDSYSFKLLEEILSKGDEDKKLLVEGFYLAQKLHKNSDALAFIHKLEYADVQNREKWLLSEYYFLLNNNDLNKAEELLIQEAKESIQWKVYLAQFYVGHKEYKKAFAIYREMFEKTKDINLKQRYFIEAIRSLEAGKYLKFAANFAYKYEDYFISSKRMRTFILKLYLATNDLKKAAEYSKKILKEYE